MRTAAFAAVLFATAFTALMLGPLASANTSVGSVSVFPSVVRAGQTGLSIDYTFHSSATFTGDIFIAGNPFGGSVSTASCGTFPNQTSVPVDSSTNPGTFHIENVNIDTNDTCGFALNNVTAPVGGIYPITGQSEASGSSVKAPLSGSPSVDVLAADGSGTMQISPTATTAASTGHTYTLTYTADPGGLVAGELTVDVPAGFSAPSTTGTDPGYTTSTCGTVTPTGQEIDLTNVTLAGGNSCTITYGDKGGSGPGVSANTTYGANSFSTEETSGDGGSLTAIGTSPSVFVTPASFTVTDSLGGGHANAGSAFGVTVTAKDAQGATLTSYAGQVDFSSSDSSVAVTLPNNYSFNGGDNGTHTFSSSVTLVTAGAQTVTATDDVHNSITGTDNVAVDPGSATHLKVTGATTLAAGSADGVTITALDSYGNTATSLTGTKNVTIGGTAHTSPGGGAPFWINKDGAGQTYGSTAKVIFVNGVATQSTGGASASQLDVTLKDAENATITATDTDDGISASGGNALSVTVTPLAATHFSINGSTSWIAGDTHTMTVTALDPYGNTDTSYTGTHDLTFSGADDAPDGTHPTATDDTATPVDFGSATPSDFTAGVASVPVTFYDWEFAFLAVTDGTISTGGSLQIGVDSAATDHYTVADTATQATGATQGLSVMAVDPYGNGEPNYNGDVALTFSGADNAPDGSQPTVTDNTGTPVDAFSGTSVTATFAGGTASSAVAAGELELTLYDAETAHMSVTDGTYSGSFSVTADPSLQHFGISGPSTATAGVAFGVTITAYDAYENVVQSYNNDGNGCTDLTMTGADASPSGTHPTAGGCGSNGTGPQPLGGSASYRFPGPPFGPGGVENTTVTLYDAENATLRITDGSHFTPDADALSVTVGPTSAAKFGITNVPAKTPRGEAFSVTTSALDTYGNVTTTTQDEHYTLSAVDGTGTLSGALNGTIFNGSASDTLNRVGYDTEETIHLQASGDLTTSAASAPITFTSPDGQGTMSVNPSHVVPGSSGNELSFAYTPAEILDSGSVRLVVPNDWPAPSTNPSDPGYTTSGCSSCGHAGDVSVSGQTITVSNIQTNQTIFVQYGANGGVTAPSTSGGEVWTASSQTESDSGGFQPLATSPTVYVDSSDGTGTLDVSNGLIAGSTGNDETLTFTAAAGGLGGGSITIAHPSGWAAFSADTTDTSDCSGCTVSYPDGNLELDNVTLASGQTLTIDYTTDAPQVAGTTSFATQEASSPDGTLTDLADAQTVHVFPAPLYYYGISGNTTQTAGNLQGLTIVALDRYGNVESSGPSAVEGDVALTFSGADTAPDGTDVPTVSDKNGDAIDFGDPTTVTFTDGEAAGDANQLHLILYDAEAASIGVTDGTVSSLSGFGITVSPASFSGFTVTNTEGGAIGTQRSGVAFVALATAVDEYGNTEAGYSGTVDFSTNDAACDSGCDSNFGGFSNGVLGHSFTLVRSGPDITISVADHADSSKNGTSAAFLIVPTFFDVSLAGGDTLAAGNSEDLTITAEDADLVTASSCRGTVDIGTSDPGASTVVPSSYTFTSGDSGSHTFSAGVTLTTAGAQSVTATDESDSDATGAANQTIVPADPTQVLFTSNTNPVAAGSTKSLTAGIYDPYGNQVDSNATVTFAQTDGDGAVTGLGDESAVHGLATDVVTGSVTGSVTITASSGGLAPDTSTFTVQPGVPTQLAFTSSSDDLASGTSRTLTAQVEDADGNLIPSATNHVTIAKIGGAGTVTLGTASSGGGITSRSARGLLAGSVSIQATAAGLTPATTTFTVVPGTAAKLAFTSAGGSLASGYARDLTVVVKDAAGNLVTSDVGRSVTFQKSGGAGTVSGLGNALSSAGSATVAVTGVKAGSLTVKASAAGLSSTSMSLNIVPGDPAVLAFTSSTASLKVGHTRKLAVSVEDAAGNAATASLTITFAACSGSGTVAGLPQSPVSVKGKATATITATGAGPIVICATADGVSGAATSFKIKS